MLRSAKQLQVVLEAASNPEKWKTNGIERIPDEREIHFLLKKAERGCEKNDMEEIKTEMIDEGQELRFIHPVFICW